MSRLTALEGFPGAEPVPGALEIRKLPEWPEEWDAGDRSETEQP